MRWGLVPHFAKSLADFKGFSTINARAESLQTTAMWRLPFQRRRCLIPADGFYEWKKLDAKTKQPFAYSLKGWRTLRIRRLVGSLERSRRWFMVAELQHHHDHAE